MLDAPHLSPVRGLLLGYFFILVDKGKLPKTFSAAPSLQDGHCSNSCKQFAGSRAQAPPAATVLGCVCRDLRAHSLLWEGGVAMSVVGHARLCARLLKNGGGSVKSGACSGN